VDRFLAAMQTIENFVVSCTSSGFGISVNRKYIGQLVGICLKYATAAVEQLAGNVARYSAAEPGKASDLFCVEVIEETKQLLMNVVERAATQHDCVERGILSQVSHMHIPSPF